MTSCSLQLKIRPITSKTPSPYYRNPILWVMVAITTSGESTWNMLYSIQELSVLAKRLLDHPLSFKWWNIATLCGRTVWWGIFSCYLFELPIYYYTYGSTWSGNGSAMQGHIGYYPQRSDSSYQDSEALTLHSCARWVCITKQQLSSPCQLTSTFRLGQRLIVHTVENTNCMDYYYYVGGLWFDEDWAIKTHILTQDGSMCVCFLCVCIRFLLASFSHSADWRQVPNEWQGLATYLDTFCFQTYPVTAVKGLTPLPLVYIQM